MFVDWFKNVSAIFVDVYEIYATRVISRTLFGGEAYPSAEKQILQNVFYTINFS